MTNNDLSVLLATCIIPGIVDAFKVSDDNLVEFIDKFYRSRLFDILKDEDTAVWHLSATTLADLYSEEQETGVLNFPEEQ